MRKKWNPTQFLLIVVLTALQQIGVVYGDYVSGEDICRDLPGADECWGGVDGVNVLWRVNLVEQEPYSPIGDSCGPWTSQQNANGVYLQGCNFEFKQQQQVQNLAVFPLAIYQSECWEPEGQDSKVALNFFDVTPGQYYLVRVHFLETLFFNHGKRKFGIEIEEQQYPESLLDIVAEINGHNKALRKTYLVQAQDNALNISFVRDVAHPFLNAIEIAHIQSNCPGAGECTQLPTIDTCLQNNPGVQVKWKINLGSDNPVYNTQCGDWQTPETTKDFLQYNCQKFDSIQPIQNLNSYPQELYQSMCWEDRGTNPMRFIFENVRRGQKYLIKFHLAELSHQNQDERKFGIQIDGVNYPKSENEYPIDTFEISGGRFIGVRRQYVVEATSDNECRIVVQFVRTSYDNPHINGIEVAEVFQLCEDKQSQVPTFQSICDAEQQFNINENRGYWYFDQDSQECRSRNDLYTGSPNLFQGHEECVRVCESKNIREECVATPCGGLDCNQCLQQDCLYYFNYFNGNCEKGRFENLGTGYSTYPDRQTCESACKGDIVEDGGGGRRLLAVTPNPSNCQLQIPQWNRCFDEQQSDQFWRIKMGTDEYYQDICGDDWIGSKNQIANFEEIGGNCNVFKRPFQTIQNQNDFDFNPSIFLAECFYQSVEGGKYQFSNIDVNQRYYIRFFFAELWFLEAGKRTFDVLIDDELMVEEADTYLTASQLFQNAGFSDFRYVAFTRDFTIKATSNVLTIQLRPGQYNTPHINAMEIFKLKPECVPVLSATPTPASTPALTPTTTPPLSNCQTPFPAWNKCFDRQSSQFWRIKMGTDEYYQDICGDDWIGSKNQIANFEEIGGNCDVFKRPFQTIQNQNDFDFNPTVFLAECFYQSVEGGKYQFTNIDPNKKYFIRLFFAELWFLEAGKRTFDILIDDELMVEEADTYLTASELYQNSGFQDFRYVAFTRDFVVHPKSSTIVIHLQPGDNNTPHINAIEVYKLDHDCDAQNTPTPAPYYTPTPTPTTIDTPTPTPSPYYTPTPTPATADTPVPTLTPTPTSTDSPNPTPTPSPYYTSTPVPTLAPTPTSTDSATPTITPAQTTSPTIVATPTSSLPPSNVCDEYIPQPNECYHQLSHQYWKINFGLEISAEQNSCCKWEAYEPGVSSIKDFTIEGQAVAYSPNVQIKNADQIEQKSEIFFSEIYFVNGDAKFIFDHTVVGHKYFLRMYFSELYFTASGVRYFDVEIDGDVTLDDFDTYDQASQEYQGQFVSYQHVGVIRQFLITAKSEQITITFKKGLENPHINAIELYWLPFQCQPFWHSAFPPHPEVGICPEGTTTIVRTPLGNKFGPISEDECGVWTLNHPQVENNCQLYNNNLNINEDIYPSEIYKPECYSSVQSFDIRISGLTQGVRYRLRLHFAEIFPGGFYKGFRVFNILVDGKLTVKGWDTYKLAGQGGYGIRKEVEVYAGSDQVLVTLEKNVENVHIAAIEVLESDETNGPINPMWLDAGNVDIKSSVVEQQIYFALKHEQSIIIDEIVFRQVLEGDSVNDLDAFYLKLPSGHQVHAQDALYAPSPILTLSPELSVFQVVFSPQTSSFFEIIIEFYYQGVAIHVVHVQGNSQLLPANLPPNHTLHPVIRAKQLYIDWNKNGEKQMFLDGSDSHTHSQNNPIIDRVWSNKLTNQVLLQGVDQIDFDYILPTGQNEIQLTLFDQLSNLSTSVIFDIAPPDEVPGTLVMFYVGDILLEDLQLYKPYDMKRVLEQFSINQPSIYQFDEFFVRMLGFFTIQSTVTVEFTVLGQITESYIIMEKEGQPFANIYPPTNNIIQLTQGTYSIDFRTKALQISTNSPIQLVATGLPQVDVKHDETQAPPVIQKLTDASAVAGQTDVVVKITVFSYDPYDFSVYVGGVIVTQILDYQDDYIKVQMPVENQPGQKEVYILSKSLTSNIVYFEYLPQSVVPVKFNLKTWNGNNQYGIYQNSAVLTWCHGKLYTASAYNGIVEEHTFDENWDNPTTTQIFNLNSKSLSGDSAEFKLGLSERSVGTTILGITCDIYDPSDNYTIYIAHAHIYYYGGNDPGDRAFPYLSYVSKIRSVDWSNSFETIIYNLPTSNHDHSVNGLDMDGQGNLIIGVGGQTNAGLAAPKLGYLPESPLSAAIIKCPIHDPYFDGHIKYKWWEHTDDQIKQNYNEYDQRVGDWVCHDPPQPPYSSCFVFAPGFRNPFDVVYTQNGLIFGTDNGPNTGYGIATDGPENTSPYVDALKVVKNGDFFEPYTWDELLHVVYNDYYGHPNLSRGRCLQDARQFKYYHPIAEHNPPIHHAAIAEIQSSADGIAEYRAATFNYGIRGDLFISKYNDRMFWIKLSQGSNKYYIEPQNFKSSKDVEALPNTECLDVFQCPGGTLICVKYEQGTQSYLQILVPEDSRAVNGQIVVYDIYPWRAPRCPGGTGIKFEIRGENFDQLAEPVSVTFHKGLLEESATNVQLENDKVISGYVPCFNNAPNELLHIKILDANEESHSLLDAFQYQTF